MADAEPTTEPTGYPAVALLANSYDFQELEKAALKAEALKTDLGRFNAFGRLAADLAEFQDIIVGNTLVATPEGTELAETEDADGRIVTAPVAIVGGGETAPDESLREVPDDPGLLIENGAVVLGTDPEYSTIDPADLEPIGGNDEVVDAAATDAAPAAETTEEPAAEVKDTSTTASKKSAAPAADAPTK